MNRIKTIAFSFFMLFAHLSTSVIFAQTVRFPYDPRPAKEINFPPLDTTRIRVQYRMLYVKDAGEPDNKTENIMLLQVGNKISKFFNYHRFLSDSLGNALARKNKPRSEVSSEKTTLIAGTIPLRIFKNYPQDKITTVNRIPFSAYRYEEEMKNPDWKLESGTTTILGYVCKKATTTLHGRNYTAWYAPEIPIDNGPWKFGGLPGLILKAEDDKGHYSFECIGIERPNWIDTIYYISYTPFTISKKKFFELEKQYYANPAAAVQNTGMIQGELPASASKARPYNPIELAD